MKYTSLLLFILFISGYSTMQPPRYFTSTDNILSLRGYSNSKFIITKITQPVNFDSTCRMIGFIQPADGLTFSEFIMKAFNDEMKMADAFSKTGRKITGTINEIKFSSISGITSGFWDISLSLVSANGKSLNISNRYEFKSGFDAITACNATADALTPAVQDLIYKIVADSNFSKLLK